MVLIRHLLTVRMHIKICLVDCTWGQTKTNMTQIQALFSPTVLELRKKLKAPASSTKSQQLRALKFLFYTALQITFLFSLLTLCIYSHMCIGRVKVACHFPFWERKFYVIFALGSESSRGRKFHGTKVPGSESSRERKFHPWNFRSRERKYVGTKVPVTGIMARPGIRTRVPPGAQIPSALTT